MSTIVTMMLEEVMNTPLTQEEIVNIHKAAAKARIEQPKDDDECPKQTKEDLAQFRSLKEVKPELYAKLHPECYKPKKTEIHIRVDTDVLEWYKSQGKGYQTKMNAVLRAHAFG